ncbi:hypothetical protein RND81_11G027000 [Saponaria officinalis]|uniref:Mitochondrial splicing suppressor 51-like C-terminal domain-containing protein n=1 Tax=Saponaria officinalis TaxID=3572 RepID=A0AAW1HGB4_SAPOF
MECAAKGRSSRCIGPSVRKCDVCQAVAYCSLSHQILHSRDHRKECRRLKEQMENAHIVNEFPFPFSEEATTQICEKKGSRCSFLARRKLHEIGMWSHECPCRLSDVRDTLPVLVKCWNLSSMFAPCTDPVSPLTKQLSSWKEYYKWRSIPLDSPAALLLQWPLTIYRAVQLNVHRMPNSEASKEILNIHYLGPDTELSQLAVFGELLALLPQFHVHIELVGPAVPQHRDGERVNLDTFAYCDDKDCKCKMPNEGTSSAVTLRLLKGFYHDRFRDTVKDCFPHLIVAPNAGIAAYPSWKETIELIHLLNVPAVFTDFCEEAAQMAAACLSSITGCEPTLPIELNPFRQPLAVEDSVLNLPCYSNCLTFGI